MNILEAVIKVVMNLVITNMCFILTDILIYIIINMTNKTNEIMGAEGFKNKKVTLICFTDFSKANVLKKNANGEFSKNHPYYTYYKDMIDIVVILVFLCVCVWSAAVLCGMVAQIRDLAPI